MTGYGKAPDDQLSLPGLGRDDDERLAAMRADVLSRFRREWSDLDGLRRDAANMIKSALAEPDPRKSVDNWKAAKIAAETILLTIRALSIKQQGEHATWGASLLDGGDDAGSRESVIVYLPDNGR